MSGRGWERMEEGYSIIKDFSGGISRYRDAL